MLGQLSGDPASYGPYAAGLAIAALAWVTKNWLSDRRQYVAELKERAQRAERSEQEWKDRTLALLTQNERVTTIAEKATEAVTSAVAPEELEELRELFAELRTLRDQAPP